MREEEITTLFDYTYWANRRLLDVVKLLDAQELDLILLPGSPCIMDILTHSLGAEMMWWTRLALGTTLPGIPDRSNYPTLDALIIRWQEQETQTRALIAGLSEEDLSSPFRYTTTTGKQYVMPRWEILVHLANHETQHRAEIAMLLTALGKSPGDLDFIVYLRDKM